VTAPEARRLTVFVAHPSEVLTDYLPHGDGLVSFGFIRRLAERGHELHVAAQRVEVRGQLPANLHIYQLSAKGGHSTVPRLAFMLRMRALFERLRRRIPFDIIHQMNPVFTGLSLSLIGVRTPLVLGTFVPRWESELDQSRKPSPWRAGVRDTLRRHVARLQQAQAAALLIASPLALSRISQPVRHSSRIYEVPHGIDATRFDERTLVPGRPSVLFLANVLYRKGVFTLLDAFDQVAAAIPGAELVIAGGGDDLGNVRRKVAQMPGRNIRVLGHVDRSGVQDVMRQHSVYCLPSYGEPFATSILEAMACGVPVVATHTGAIPDLVTRAGGRLVAPRDAAALAAALVEILASTELQRQMGRHNRVRVETEFEAEKAADRLEEAYHTVRRAASGDGGLSARRPALGSAP
jgi:glycosyltransferase involved in cell wall biosynthesis